MGGLFSKSKPYDKPADVPSKHFPAFVETLPSLVGKTIAITGTTSGTGYHTALTCAKKGASVVLLNRPSERATAAQAKLQEMAGPGASFTAVECDLQSFASVRAAAAQLNAKFASTGLDVLCNNAGVMALADVATDDGYDVQMQTNHLSHFLLLKEVFPLLEKAASERGEARVVHHTSLARFGEAFGEKELLFHISRFRLEHQLLLRPSCPSCPSLSTETNDDTVSVEYAYEYLRVWRATGRQVLREKRREPRWKRQQHADGWSQVGALPPHQARQRHLHGGARRQGRYRGSDSHLLL